MADPAPQGSLFIPQRFRDSTGISGSTSQCTYPNITLNAFTQSNMNHVDTPRLDLKDPKGSTNAATMEEYVK